MDSRKVLALLDIIECVVDKRKDLIQQRLDELEKELSSESDPFSRLGNVISARQASDFRKILHKNALSEQAVCTKYGVDCIEELTGSDVLDVLTGIVLSNQDQKQ
jgi:hypothetical protein